MGLYPAQQRQSYSLHIFTTLSPRARMRWHGPHPHTSAVFFATTPSSLHPQACVNDDHIPTTEQNVHQLLPFFFHVYFLTIIPCPHFSWLPKGNNTCDKYLCAAMWVPCNNHDMYITQPETCTPSTQASTTPPT